MAKPARMLKWQNAKTLCSVHHGDRGWRPGHETLMCTSWFILQSSSVDCELCLSPLQFLRILCSAMAAKGMCTIVFEGSDMVCTILYKLYYLLDIHVCVSFENLTSFRIPNPVFILDCFVWCRLYDWNFHILLILTNGNESATKCQVMQLKIFQSSIAKQPSPDLFSWISFQWAVDPVHW